MTGLLDILGFIAFLTTIIFGMLGVKALMKEEAASKHWRNLGISFVVMVVIAWLKGAVS